MYKDDNSEVHFRYDASGNRIAKITETDTTIYARDASGNVMAVYKNDTLVEQSIYGSSRLGMMTATSKAGYRTLGGKKYELSNHLGNVLAVVSNNIHLDQDSTWASVVNVTDYYPFGLAMDGRSEQDSSYRYGFNGKEEDSAGEWGGQSHYDYGFRIYNPSIAKFLSVDPLATNYPYFSPFQFAGNKPVMFIDLDGAEFQLPTFEKFKYGDNAAINVITVVDNVAINSVNGGITLVNSGIYTIHKVFTDPTSIPEELKSDLGAMAAETGKYVKAQSSYVWNTPFSIQLKDGVETLKNPESYEGPAELATALFLTKNFGNSVAKNVPTNGSIPRTLANTTKGWKVGNSINNLTSKGNVPAWSTVRQRHWKNRANNASPDDFSDDNLIRMRKGLAPQKFNPERVKMESMELHHTPPQRDGGRFDFKEVWPDEHEAIDPYRRTGN